MFESDSLEPERPHPASATCATLAAILFGAFGCGEGTVEPQEQSTGSIQVTTMTNAATDGASLDPDGYTVAVSDQGAWEIELNGRVVVDNVSAGDHSVALEGLQVNCTTRQNPTSATVTTGVVADVSFEITCWPPTTGRIAFSSDSRGAKTYRGSGVFDVYSINPDGTGLERLSTADVADLWPTWSPDGWRIAYSALEGVVTKGYSNIYVMNADGTGGTKLTESNGKDQVPTWSPDGSRIAFTRIIDNNAEIHVMNADGTGTAQVGPVDAYYPDWTPDGSKLVFTCGWDVCSMNPDGTDVVNLTDHPAYDWTMGHFVSPDGAKIAFNSDRDDGSSDVFLMNLDGTDPVNLTTSVSVEETAAWSPDGTKILFTSGVHVYYMNLDGTGVTAVTSNVGGNAALYPDWSHGSGIITMHYIRSPATQPTASAARPPALQRR